MNYNTKSYAGYGTSPSSWEEYLGKVSTERKSSEFTNLTIEPTCKHEWKETRLVVSSVYDCKKCNCKREEVEKCHT